MACCSLLAGRGARVTIDGRNRDRLEATVKQLGDRAQAVAVDAGQADDPVVTTGTGTIEIGKMLAGFVRPQRAR